MKIFKASDELVKLCEHYECEGDVSKYLNAYKCPAGVWTIGIGTTIYPNGIKVKQGDKITVEQAFEYFKFNIRFTEMFVDSITRDDVTQGQFDALVDFAYNSGTGALKSSTLLKKVNSNPNDTDINRQFCKWIYGGDGTKNGKDDDGDGLVDEPGELQYLEGLKRRRMSEAYLYFNGINKFDF